MARSRHADLGERLAEAIEFAAEGKVLAHIHKAKLADINRVFTDLKAGRVDGRVVLELE
jgi:propanol-preferring alcohol dehydrogenase